MFNFTIPILQFSMTHVIIRIWHVVVSWYSTGTHFCLTPGLFLLTRQLSMDWNIYSPELTFFQFRSGNPFNLHSLLFHPIAHLCMRHRSLPDPTITLHPHGIHFCSTNPGNYQLEPITLLGLPGKSFDFVSPTNSTCHLNMWIPSVVTNIQWSWWPLVSLN